MSYFPEIFIRKNKIEADLDLYHYALIHRNLLKKKN